jgi:TM2 domain-containing membrane protein YozV
MSEAAAWYYVGSFGQLGPLTLEQMEELIDGGVIEKSTYVWKPSMNDWLPAGNVTELMAAFKLIEPMASPPPVPGHIFPPVQTSVVPPPNPGSLTATSNSPMRSVSIQPHGYPRALHLPKSDKSRTVSGILQLFIPGAGRIYLGYAALGVIQLVLFFATCGFAWIWSLVDGIMILSGKVGIDGYGRALED